MFYYKKVILYWQHLNINIMIKALVIDCNMTTAEQAYDVMIYADMDEFDSRFDFTAMEEPNMDMEMSSIALRSSSEGWGHSLLS